MSYDLFFYAPDAPLTQGQFESHFLFRGNYRVNGGEAIYENEDTGVYFVFHWEDPSGDGEGSHASFNINYYRPHFFGLEAAPEVLAFVERFRLKINDPQMDGMGGGPFTSEGFLKAWNAGNLFGYQAMQDGGGVPAVYPTAGLERAWAWNIQRSQLQQKFDHLFVPRIVFFNLDSRVITATIWGDAMPILLPETDYVVVGRKGLAAHSIDPEVMETCVVPWRQITAGLASFPAHSKPMPYLEVSYFEPPDNVIELIQAQQIVAEGSLEMLRSDEVLNEELVTRALQNANKQT